MGSHQKTRDPVIPQLPKFLKPGTEIVTIVDRLVHRSEIVQIDGESYRLKESKEEASKRRKARKNRRPPTKPS
jgi:hypothetical protein